MLSFHSKGQSLEFHYETVYPEGYISHISCASFQKKSTALYLQICGNYTEQLYSTKRVNK
jgi:hypothetical protein